MINGFEAGAKACGKGVNVNNNNIKLVKGEKGDTPYIGDNGNWWISGNDTGVKAEGSEYVITEDDYEAIADISANKLQPTISELDESKVDKVEGKGLSTNDYTNADKSKVDAIPPNPKYTDTVYDDTEIREEIADVRQAVNDKMSFYPVECDGYKFTHTNEDGTVIELGFAELADKYNDPRWFLYCEYASITFIPSLPPVEDPIHPDRVLEFSAAWYYDGSHWLTSIKINEGNQIKIEEHQIPTRDEMQTALAEKVGYTDYATSGTYGVLRGGSDGFALYNGSAYAATYSQEQYNSKGNTTFISKGTIENIKSDLTKRALTDNTQPAYTEAEQLSARQRIGIDTTAELVQTIVLEEGTQFIRYESNTSMKAVYFHISGGENQGARTVFVGVNSTVHVWASDVGSVVLKSGKSHLTVPVLNTNGVIWCPYQSSGSSQDNAADVKIGDIMSAHIYTSDGFIAGTTVKIYAVK